MLVLKDLSLEIPGTNTHYIGFDEYSQPSEDTVLLFGFNNLHSNKLFNEIKDFKRKIYFNVTMPTEFGGDHDISLDDKFDEIYTICPYSVEWLNEVKNTDKYKLAWYPFDPIGVDDAVGYNKTHDVCYHGGIHGNKYVEMLQVIGKFNYRFMSMTHGINNLTQQNLGFATDTDLSHWSKIDVISKCKMSVCFNNYPFRGNIGALKSRPSWELNKAFQLIESHGLCPQIKSRLNEAAATKTLNLVERDPWNVVEHFYEPDKHFIYFDGLNDLEQKIFEISTNWEDYKHIADAANKHFLCNYTTSRLYNHIKDQLS